MNVTMPAWTNNEFTDFFFGKGKDWMKLKQIANVWISNYFYFFFLHKLPFAGKKQKKKIMKFYYNFHLMHK